MFHYVYIVLSIVGILVYTFVVFCANEDKNLISGICICYTFVVFYTFYTFVVLAWHCLSNIRIVYFIHFCRVFNLVRNERGVFGKIWLHFCRILYVSYIRIVYFIHFCRVRMYYTFVVFATLLSCFRWVLHFCRVGLTMSVILSSVWFC